MFEFLNRQSTRAYLYRVLSGGLAVLAGYDLVRDTDVPLWLALGGAMLGLGVASANTPTKTDS